MAFQALLQLAQALELLLPDAGGGNLGPELDDMGQILHGELGVALGAEGPELGVQLELFTLELCHAGVVRLGLLLRDGVQSGILRLQSGF